MGGDADASRRVWGGTAFGAEVGGGAEVVATVGAATLFDETPAA
jgi:hypothetical protein